MIDDGFADRQFTDRLYAERIGGSAFGRGESSFKFEAIKRAKRAAREAHPETPLIDLGVGEPDAPAFSIAVDALAREAGLSENRLYADNGIPEFRVAAARYLESVYGVAGLDPEAEIVPGIGTKSIFAMLPLAFINPGDVALVTVPGYPILATHTRYLGGAAWPLPLVEAHGFLPNFDLIPGSVLARAKLLYINYPNNPTGAVATGAFFRDVVAFARRTGVLVVHDAAYGALVYGDRKPLSFLSIPGAKEVGVEVHSLSKAFNMTGWRLGFIAGNAGALAAYAAVKDTVDSGQFRAMQKAGACALAHPELTALNVEKYRRRFGLLVPALRSAGFDAHESGGTFYCYARAPIGTADGRRFDSAAAFSDWLIRERLVSTVPWDDAGAYVRFSVTFEAPTPADEVRVIADLGERLRSARLVFA